MSRETRSEVLVLALIAAVLVVGGAVLMLFHEQESALVFIGAVATLNTVALLRLAWKG